jgi:hypothetical protein
MFLVAGNVVVKRLPNHTLTKVPTSTYDQHNYVNLFKVAKELNQPHFDRIYGLFAWLDKQQADASPLGEELRSMVAYLKKAPPDHATPEQLSNQEKKNWLLAYNSYYDMSYLPEDVGLDG